MSQATWSFVVAFWLLGTTNLAVDGCPAVCSCIGRERVSVYCDFRGLEQVPDDIPLETTHLYLNGNKFTSVVPDMFYGNTINVDGTRNPKGLLTQLRVIRLDLNPIQVVNEHAFDRVPTLELIYLPVPVKLQRQALTEMKLDMDAFLGYSRVPIHPLEDPTFVAFTKA